MPQGVALRLREPPLLPPAPQDGSIGIAAVASVGSNAIDRISVPTPPDSGWVDAGEDAGDDRAVL